MKKRKPLKPSFVVTIAAAGAAAALATSGCLGDISTTNPPYVEEDGCPDAIPVNTTLCDTPGTCHYESECGPIDAVCEEGKWSVPLKDDVCNPPPIAECPGDVPEIGGYCQEEVGTCLYYDPDCAYAEFTATCVDGAWVVELTGTCNPPAVVCPEKKPSQNDPCEGIGSCEYTDSCGQPVIATCDGTQWVVEEEICNPPPPCEALSQDGRAFNDECVWHTPGCGDETIPALPQAGCFSITACATDADCPIGTCQQVMVTPDCVDEGCDACGQAVYLCVQ